ncbi:MAG TPA: ABC transporter ATP-binding protein [Tepidisphaeraceae bacterium]|nr:ABC transporter ATP-binding protein [Tepidisphaeraceae bacterium]
MTIHADAAIPGDSSASIDRPGIDRASQHIISLTNVSKTYGAGAGRFIALHPLSLAIQRGRMLALLGRSGSGKSTLLNLLGAVDLPTTGAVMIGGTDISKLSQEQLALFRRRRLGFVFQSFHLLPSLTAFDNVATPWLLDRALTAQRKKEVADLLARLGLADKGRRYPDELSGGQQQRVALARAVVHRPELLLADEPTGNLDAQSGREILDLLGELHREFGMTVVMATHSPQAAERCEQRITLEDGRVKENRLGTPTPPPAPGASASDDLRGSGTAEPLAAVTSPEVGA